MYLYTHKCLLSKYKLLANTVQDKTQPICSVAAIPLREDNVELFILLPYATCPRIKWAARTSLFPRAVPATGTDPRRSLLLCKTEKLLEMF